VMADEPTAKLDPENAARIRQILKDIATRRRVIVATHDPKLLRLADKKIRLRAAHDCASENAA
jgi:ATP-binding cassette, subfamily C, bacterial CydD